MPEAPPPEPIRTSGGGKPPTPTLKDLRPSDILLALILGLGLARLAGIVVQSLLTTPGGDPLGEGPGRLTVVVVVLGLQAAAMIGAVYWVAVRNRGLAWAELGVNPIPRHWVTRAAAAALIGYLLVVLVNLGVQSLMGEPLRNPQFDVVAPVGFSWDALIAVLVLAGVVVPIAEEFLFRGFLYGWLREHLGVPAAAVISGFGFSVLHGIVWLIPALTLLGVILALVYERSGSIWTAVIAHGLFNAITTILFYIALASGFEL